MLFNHRSASATRKSHPAGDNDQDRCQETVPKSHLASWTAEAELKSVRKPSPSPLKMCEMLRPASIYFCLFLMLCSFATIRRGYVLPPFHKPK